MVTQLLVFPLAAALDKEKELSIMDMVRAAEEKEMEKERGVVHAGSRGNLV